MVPHGKDDADALSIEMQSDALLFNDGVGLRAQTFPWGILATVNYQTYIGNKSNRSRT